MIRLNWEECALLILFAALAGNFIEKGNYWVVGAALTMVAALAVSGARRSPQESST